MITAIPYLKIIEQTCQTPDAIAVLHGETQLTYAQLHRLSNQVATYLRTQGVGRNSLVGIMTDRNPLMLVGILGILKAGGAYVPLDPAYPAERIRYILEHAQIGALLTEYSVSQQVEACIADTSPLQTIVFLDEGEPLADLAKITQISAAIWSEVSDSDPTYDNDPNDLMTVLYTSGSTGKPKGVMLNHQGYMNRLEWMQKTFSLKPGDRVAQKTSFCFDISVWELFWTLMEGATICPVAREIVLNPWEFAQWMNERQINVMHFVPSLFGEFVSALEGEDWTFPDLRWLIFSGEALPLLFIQRWIDQYGMETGLANLYGPTEASIDVTCHLITERPETGTIPIGKAIDNVDLRILDEQMQPLNPGEIGELWIGGIQLAKGYLNEPQKTAAAFCPNPFPEIPGEYLYRTGDLAKELPDGSIAYHGRIDHQVKIRGFRVELGEIESVLSTHPAVREAAVLAVDLGEEGQKRLIAWVAGEEVAPHLLKQHLSRQLPNYMLPSQIHWVSRLPKNHNGKLDRKALLAQFKGEPAKIQNQEELFPLGSAQRWLVSYFDAPYQWTGYSRFRYHKPLNLDIFTQALNLLVQRHSILRTVFVQRDEQWFQQVIEQPQPMEINFFDGSHLSSAERDQEIHSRIQSLSQQLYIDRFPLISTLVVKVDEACYDISMALHHIIADMLSGSIIFKEFWSAYDQLLAGKTPSWENPAPLAYLDFVHLLQTKDQQGGLDSHVAYWQSQFPSPDYRFEIPLDQIAGANIEASAASEIFALSQVQTQLLRRQATRHYGCNLYILLLAPVYQLMAHWSNQSWVVLSHRLHGRDLGVNQGFWDSIGDFAVNCPVGITVNPEAPWEQTIEQIKAQFGQLPMNGASFDWISERLPEGIYPDEHLTPVRANYLGNRTLPSVDVFEFLAEERDRRWSPPLQKRTTLLEFFFYLMEGTLYLEIEYSRHFHQSPLIRHLGEEYLTLIHSLLAHFSHQEVCHY